MANDNSKSSQASLYDQYFFDSESKLIQDVFKVLKHLKYFDGCKVLDLGCGTGRVTAMLAERVWSTSQITAVDPDEERIKFANEENKLSNITYFVGDDQNLPDDQTEYDVVFCQYVTHWIENKQGFFQNIGKKLRPGGHLVIIAITGQEPISQEMSQLMGPLRQATIDERLHLSSSEVYDQLAIDNGFRLMLKEEDIATVTYLTPDDILAAWMAITHGAFNPELADQDDLAMFKEKYSGIKIERKIPITRYIFTKQ